MSRRLVYLGLVLVLSQLSTGCFWHHWGYYRYHCNPCRPLFGPHCAPACPTSVCASPAVRGPDCPCATPNGGPYPVIGAPPAGVPIISSPMPIYPGAPGTSTQELPNPRPANPNN